MSGKNMKRIKLLFILFVLIISFVFVTGCALCDKDSNNGGFTSTEVDKDSSDKNGLEDMSVTEKENDEGESSNVAAIDSDNEKVENIEKNEKELSPNDEGKNATSSDIPKNNKEVEKGTSSKETESDDVDNGIVLPNDDW